MDGWKMGGWIFGWKEDRYLDGRRIDGWVDGWLEDR